MKWIPIEEMSFAAKHGFLSRSLWEKYFSKRSRTRNIRVWRAFTEQGYFYPASGNFKNILYLGKRAKKILHSTGIDYVSPSFIGQIEHDEKVAEIAILLAENGFITGYKTESELKKEQYAWLKSKYGRGVKLPDLLLYGVNGKAIALEVETSRKSPERYKKVFESYSRMEWKALILFLSDQDKIFRGLSRGMKAVHFPTWEKPVAYGYLSKFIEKPLDEEIHFSDRKSSLREYLELSEAA